MLENIQNSIQSISPADNISKLLLALGLLVASFILASICKNIAVKVFSRWSLSIGKSKGSPARSDEATAIANGTAKFIYWLIIFAGISSVIFIYSKEFGDRAIGELYFQASNVLLALFLLIVGRLVSRFVEYTSLIISRRAGVSRPENIGKLFFGLTFVVFILLAAQQVGIEIELLSWLLLASFTMALLGLALAFGIGVAPSVAIMIQGHFLNKYLSVGDQVEMIGHVGQVSEINQKMVVLTSENAQHFIPIEKAASQGFSIRG